MIERELPRTLRRIDEDELVRVRARFDLIPELGVPWQPMRLDAIAVDFVFGEATEIAGAIVVGACALGRRGDGLTKEQQGANDERRCEARTPFPKRFHKRRVIDPDFDILRENVLS